MKKGRACMAEGREVNTGCESHASACGGATHVSGQCHDTLKNLGADYLTPRSAITSSLGSRPSSILGGLPLPPPAQTQPMAAPKATESLRKKTDVFLSKLNWQPYSIDQSHLHSGKNWPPKSVALPWHQYH